MVITYDYVILFVMFITLCNVRLAIKISPVHSLYATAYLGHKTSILFSIFHHLTILMRCVVVILLIFRVKKMEMVMGQH